VVGLFTGGARAAPETSPGLLLSGANAAVTGERLDVLKGTLHLKQSETYAKADFKLNGTFDATR
jgi:hypothetical protein